MTTRWQPYKRRGPEIGDRIRLRAECTGKLPDGIGYRARPGVEGKVQDVRPDQSLILKVGRYDAIVVADRIDVEVER